MRVVVVSDAHIDGGGALGDRDPAWLHTRIIDKRRILLEACATPCDVLVFLGDVGVGAAPNPVALSIMQEALGASPANAIALIFGNHDHGGWARSVLDVISAGLRQDTHVFHKADVVTLNGLQVGALPWTTPATFYPTAETPADAHRLVAEALEDIARGLGAKVNPKVPSLLGAHWMLAGSTLASGADIITLREPLLNADALEASGPWGLVVAGHNHKGQQVGPRSWVAGALTRDNFGEEHITPGYLVVDYDDTTAAVTRVPTNDRPLRTVVLDAAAALSGKPLDLPDVTGAVVRVKGKRTAQQERDMIAARTDDRIVDEIRMAGATRVTDPDWDTERIRRTRSDVAGDASPLAGLRVWLEQQQITGPLRDRVLTAAPKLMTDTSC